NAHHVPPIKRLGAHEIYPGFLSKLKTSEPLRQESERAKKTKQNTGRALVEIKTGCELSYGCRVLIEGREHARLVGDDNRGLIVPRQPQIPHPAVVRRWRFIFHMHPVRTHGVVIQTREESGILKRLVVALWGRAYRETAASAVQMSRGGG